MVGSSKHLLLGVAAVVLSFTGVACTNASQDDEALVTTAAPVKAERTNKRLCGVWEGDGPGHNYTVLPNGVKTYPFGMDSQARVSFRRDGYATHFVSKSAANRPGCANPAGHTACTASEAASSFYSALSVNYHYVATPDDEGTGGNLTWNVDLSTYPNWTGQSLQRRYDLVDDDHLQIIVPVGPGVTAHLNLARVAECNGNADNDK